MNGINTDLLYSSGFIEGEIKYTEWYPWHKYKEIANKLQGCMYTIVHSDKKPTKNPWEWDEKPFIRIGTTCGKGYGFTDSMADNKYFNKMSKGTTQPKDRLDDHGVNMKYGMESTQIIKGANGAHKAWPPVFKLYGSGKKLTDKVWVCFGVPRTNLTFDEQSARCEIIELANITHHKNKFNGQAPLTDLKYANTSQREMHNQILALEKSSGLARKTRIQNDDEYKGKVTNNHSALMGYNLYDIMNAIEDGTLEYRKSRILESQRTN